MKFSSFTAALCYLSSLTAAAGIPRASSAVSSNIDKRQQIDKYYIHLYEHPKYQGRRADMQAAWGICHNMIQENNDWASSARADTGGNCQLYRDYKCVGPSIALSSAGVEDFDPLGLDNRVSAFKCGP